MKKKISIIGAGTGTFAVNLMKDLCLSRRLCGSTISLMDIDETRLNAVHCFLTRYAAEAGMDYVIEKTTDRLECLRGADFVINSALVGGYNRLFRGWEIAKKLGYRFGGSLHIMHDEAFWTNFGQLQLMEEIYLDMQRVCPDAWYVMVSNPVMAAVTYFNRKYPGIKLVGMCHGYGGVYRMCDVMGLDRSKISFEIPGVNHFVWLNRFTYDGQDGKPLIEAWIRDHSEEYFRQIDASNDFGPKIIDLYRRFGLMPIGDTGTAGGGSWGWEYHADEETQKKWNENPQLWFEVIFSMNADRIQSILDAAYDHSIRLSEQFPLEPSGEPMIPLIEALACDNGQIVVVNIPNDANYVEGVPSDFEVEIPAWVDKDGIHGLHTKPLPKPLQACILRDRVAPVEMELDAYVTHSRARLVDLVMMDPWTHSRNQAEQLVEEILNMPGMEAMNAYYR